MLPVMQATVAEFDPRTRSGSVVLDDGSRLGFDADAFATSGLRLLRPGQRVALGTSHGVITALRLPTMR